MQLDPLKQYLEGRIKAASVKIVKKQQDESEDVAGFRKRLQQKVNCISCDRPVEITVHGPEPSLPEYGPMPGTRSSRPYTTFELEQIRTSQKSQVARNATHFARSLEEREIARQRKQDMIAYRVHHKDSAADELPLNQSNMNESDYLVSSRACGGTHTMTFPHRRMTRMTHLNQLFEEDDPPMALLP